MNRTQYTEVALTTALPSAKTPSYLGPMIVGEVGEMFGAWGKSVRDEWDEDRRVDTVTKELGDVAWGAAVLIATTRDSEWTPVPPKLRRSALHDLMEIALVIDDLALAGDTGTEINATAIDLWAFISTHSVALCGNHFDTALELNIEKLRDRQARGVLRGSGDFR